MTPIFSVWPAKATKELSSCVLDKMKEEGFDDSTYKSVGFLDVESDGFPRLLQDAFRSLIGVETPIATLNVVAVVPVFEDGCTDAVTRIASVIANLPNSFALHVFCLKGGIARVLDVEEKDAEKERDNIKAIASILNSQHYRTCPIVIDDYIVTGAPINFTKSLLARFLSTLMRAMGENYDALFPGVIGMDGGTVLSMGLSQAKFDRHAMVDYLLHRAFVAALESVHITQNNVDIPAASLRAEKHLEGVGKFYNGVYTAHVVPMLDQNKSEDEIAAKLPSAIKEEVQTLQNDMTSFMDDDNLTLPEKEAVFAMLLGRDSARFAGYLYDGRKKDFDDVLETPLGIYVSSYNELAVDKGLLPRRGGCKYLKLPDNNPGNAEACNPLPELKKLKAEMLDQSSFVRRKTDELEKLRNIVRGTALMGRVLVNGNIHRRSDYDVVEQPLKDIYEPKEGLEIKKTVDLRKFCSPIRDQGQLGSCSSFAVTAMYEMIVNALNINGLDKANLSERYLFYHSNVAAGNIDGGSNFSSQLKVMGKHGICVEELYPYTTTKLTEEPSSDAHNDAQKHRVLLAKQIQLKRDGHKYDNIKENHRMLTSALSEGFAVGFSLKIFDDFGKDSGGFIPLPAQPADKDSGYHAMVIVGYSEDEKCYIVRNSWGEQFGDGGYCYISSVYVDDPDYINFACIISETTEETAEMVDIPAPLTIRFGTSAAISQMAAVVNTIDEAKIYLAYLKDRYDAIFSYYSILLQRVGVPSTRNTIRGRREERLQSALNEKEGCKKYLVDTLPEKMKRLKKYHFGVRAKATVVALVLIVVAVILWKAGFTHWAATFGMIAAIATIVTVLLWANFGIKIRRYRKKLQEEIDEVVLEAERLKRNFLETQIKFYTAGIVIDEICLMKLGLEERYQSLVSYNKNLAQWYKEDKEKQTQLKTASEQMFIKIINRELLDRYFEDNRSTICRNIDLIAQFRTFRLTETSLIDLRNNLEEMTRKELDSMFGNFSMCDFVLQTHVYPYLGEPDINGLFNKLNQFSQPAVRHMAANNLNATSRCLAINHSTNVDNRLHGVYSPMFTVPPLLLNTADRDTLTVFVSEQVLIDNLV